MYNFNNRQKLNVEIKGEKMDYQLFSDIIKKIDGVLYVKSVDTQDKLEELHIVASIMRSPKQIVRDIESTLLAVFDYRIDRKVISIAQIDTGTIKKIKRIKYEGVLVETQGNNVECRVRLSHEDEEFSWIEKCIRTISNRYKVVAKATLGAVSQIVGDTYGFDVQDVLLSTSRDVSFVCVVVNILIRDKEETLVGAVVVREDINEAIVKATLDAINRRISNS